MEAGLPRLQLLVGNWLNNDDDDDDDDDGDGDDDDDNDNNFLVEYRINHCIQTSSWCYIASYPAGSRGIFMQSGSGVASLHLG
jgi:hypothetical protein